MIATMIDLNRHDCRALGMKDAYSVHKMVYSLFPRQGEQDSRDFLFADKGGDWNSRKILVLSRRAPLPMDHGRVESKEIPDSFLEYDYYGFEVLLNPVVRNGLSGSTRAVRGTENLKTWFLERSASFGFEVDPPESLQVRNEGVVVFDRNKEGSRMSQTHNTATFIGKLRVTDRSLFKKSFENGLGRAKGFGFGLLQIIPIQ